MTDQNGTLRAFGPELVFANPYQHHSARRFRGEEFDAFVEDIRVNGVHQPPPARPHPEQLGAVQLQMGHRRLAAWRAARPGEPFLVIVKPLTDLEMLEGVIEENIHRTDLNDIERAQLIETYKQVRPDATNADLARVFRLKNPASITNLRKLLQLPEPIQKHIAEDNLPDAMARQLVGVSKVNPKAAQKIAAATAAAPRSEKQEVFNDLARSLYWNQMESLEELWPLDWLADAPRQVKRDLGDGDHLIGACAGCVFHVGAHCARKACFEAKYNLWTAAEVQRIAESKKLAPLAPGEQTVSFFNGAYYDDDRARNLLNAHKEIRALLRVAPADRDHHNYLGPILGSRAVTLVVTDKAAVQAYLAERNAVSKSKTNAALSTDKEEETDAERAKRIAQEKKEQSAKRAARAAQWKSYYDALWLLDTAARVIGSEVAKSVSGRFVGFIHHEFCRHYRATDGAGGIAERLATERQQAEGKAKEALLLADVALHVIAQNAHELYYKRAAGAHEYNFERTHAAVEDVCRPGSEREDKRYAYQDKGFGVTLPDGWDVPPIHKTAFNCWQCGRFAGNMQEELTQRDLNEDGWIDDGKDGVFCSQEHKDAYTAAATANEEHHAKTKAAAKAQPAASKRKREHASAAARAGR